MPVERPFNVYREQLSSLYHGLALWKPNPEGLYDQVAIGDVGYISEGAFIRMFNVTLPWDDESNKTLGKPEHYDVLNFGDITIRREPFSKVEYYSRHVSREENFNNALAVTPEQAEGVTYRCRGRGALLSLPHGGHREDAIHTKVFEKYIRDHVVSWFNWSRDKGLPVGSMEDLVLVYGCTLVTSWAAAAFDDYDADAQVSLASRTLNNGGASFVWSNIRGTVEFHDSQRDPNGLRAYKNQCVFMKCFRAKRILFWTRHLRAAAEPLPDDPDSGQEDEIQVTQVPDVSKYRDPLIGVLDYIVEKYLEDDTDKDKTDKDDMAITHDDDLRLIKDVEALTADTIEQFLRENAMPIVVTDGAMKLRHPLSGWEVDAKVDEYEYEELSRLRTTSLTSTIVNRESDLLDVLLPPRPPPMPLPRSDTERPNHEKTGDPLSDIPSLLLLPEIRSEQIWKRILTHSSSLAWGHKYDYQAPNGDLPVDNEEFVHIGDQVLALAVTDLIQQLYPHLRVGPASKLRDRIKREDTLAEICKLYGLQTRVNLPERQASDFKASQSVQVGFFKAYVGGVYRDQGFEVVSKWLISLLRPHVELAHRSLWEDLPPVTEVPRILEPRTADYPSPQVSPPYWDYTSSLPSARRRRRTSLSDGGSGDEDEHGRGSTDGTRKRLRADGTSDG